MSDNVRSLKHNLVREQNTVVEHEGYFDSNSRSRF